jgi:hypothetical protein
VSHETVWRCRGCKAPLGLVRGDGSLEIEGQRAIVGRDGVARVQCPGCSQVRAWRPYSSRLTGRASPEVQSGGVPPLGEGAPSRTVQRGMYPGSLEITKRAEIP